MAEVGKRVKSLSMLCPEGMAEGICVDITHATGTVAVTAAGLVPDAITIGPASEARFNDGAQDEFTIEIMTLPSIDGAEFLTVETGASAVAQGDELEVIGTDGKVQTKAAGLAIGLRANGIASEDELFGAYV